MQKWILNRFAREHSSEEAFREGMYLSRVLVWKRKYKKKRRKEKEEYDESVIVILITSYWLDDMTYVLAEKKNYKERKTSETIAE